MLRKLRIKNERYWTTDTSGSMDPQQRGTMQRWVETLRAARLGQKGG